MNKYLNLFKALPVNKRSKTLSTDYIEYGVLVEDSVLKDYNRSIIGDCVKDLVPTDSQINKTFHKSWRKVRDASIEQLVAEQVIHYFTTYGLEELGLYNAETVYIPNENLELDSKGGITFYILHGITKNEMTNRVQNIVSSGIALSESDLNDLVSIIQEQDLTIDPSTSNNKEITTRLYDLLNIIPKNPVEYLRLIVYQATGKTLLIKNKETIEAIKAGCDKSIFGVHTNLFQAYENLYGLPGLASIFYRFKPLFLAFKNKGSASTINRIRRLAVKCHQPMLEDYSGSVTKHLRNNTLDINKLRESLDRVNIFRKIKLIQALQFYSNTNSSGVVYTIRNGKSFAATANPLNSDANEAISTVIESLSKDLKHLKDKQVYIDTDLAVPTSGKMFCGNVPFGSSFSTKDSLVLGVSWKDTDSRIDLDLSIVSLTGKTGWDASYRNQDFLFSGDITAAPNGATEAFLIQTNARDGIYLLNLNYFSGYGNAPFTLFAAKENEYRRMNCKAMVSQDNMLFWADSTIDITHKQKTIGVLKIKNGIKTFYIFELKTGKSITARNDKKSLYTISFYDKYLDCLLNLKELLKYSGVKIVSNPENADIDLSMKSLTKDMLINLLTEK